MTLRPDQIEVKSRVGLAFARGARAVLALCPTGWGKTYFSTDVMDGCVAKGGRVIFLAGLEEIALDTIAKLRAGGRRVSALMPGEDPDPLAPFTVAMVQTLVARPEIDLSLFTLAIWDECHHTASETWTSLHARLSRARHLGLTATAQRGDGRPLEMFEVLVAGPSTRTCIDAGLLVPVSLIAPPTVEESGLTTSPLDAYLRHAPGRRTLVFCANVAHVEAERAAFEQAGIPALALTGETAKGPRRAARAQFAAGEVDVLLGCGVFVEGFDAPSAEVAILARSFNVTGPFLQAIGRVMRLSPSTGKTDALVIDLRGSVHLHGLPDENRTWSLEGEACKRIEKMPALGRCSACGAIFRPALICPRCGETKAVISKIPRNLNRAERLERLSGLPQSELDRRYLGKLEEVAAGRMRMPEWKARAWALKQFEKTRGRKPEGVAA